MRAAQPGRCAFVLLVTTAQPPRLGTIAMEIAAAQASEDLMRSKNIQARSVLETFVFAMGPSPELFPGEG